MALCVLLADDGLDGDDQRRRGEERDMVVEGLLLVSALELEEPALAALAVDGFGRDQVIASPLLNFALKGLGPEVQVAIGVVVPLSNDDDSTSALTIF